MNRTLTADELKAAQTQIELIDVRRPGDRAADPEAIPGARWRDPEQVDQWLKELPQDKEVVIYCARGGSVSTSVLHKLRENNINVRYLEGGIAAWKQSGGATEKVE